MWSNIQKFAKAPLPVIHISFFLEKKDINFQHYLKKVSDCISLCFSFENLQLDSVNLGLLQNF